MEDFESLLDAMARHLERKMIEIGGDPRDPTEVESFVNGCGIAKKLKARIADGLDDE